MTSTDLALTLSQDFETALARTREALAAEGFGIVTEVDLQDTLKKKLGAEVRPYRILGACNPRFAHEGITLEPRMGLSMPCNVIVYATDGGTAVAAVDPTQIAGNMGAPQLEPLAAKVRERLAAAIARLR